jgi:TPR repeat protein
MFLTALKAKLAVMVAVAGLNTDEMPGLSKDMLTTLENLAAAQKSAAEDPGKGPDVNASFNEALAKVNDLAQKGDKDAQYALAHWGVLSNSNLNEVVDLYRKAAAQGQVLAKAELAQVLLQAGQQNEEAVKEAVKLITEAEAADNKVARRLLAQLHLGGVGGVEQSLDKARALLEKGSAAGDGEATLNLSQLYAVGAPGLPKDDKKSLEYLIKASEQENAVAMSTYAARLFDGDPEGSAQLVKKNPEKAMKMFEDAAAKGFAAANRLLGAIYENGMGGAQRDLKKAVEYYTKAANGNDAQALFRLGNYFEAGLTQGEGDKAETIIQKNDKSALDLYRLAAQNNLPEAFYNVGVYYETGTVVDKDPAKAYTFFLRAANNGLAPAQFRLAGLYQSGNGVAQDVVAAKAWYQMSADRGNAAAQLALGQMYETGIGGGGPQPEAAAQQYSNAAAQGVPLAMLRLASLAERGLNTAKNQPDLSRALAWADMAVDASNKAELAVKYRDELKAKMKADQIAEAKKIYDTMKKSSSEGAAAPAPSR